MIISFLGFIGSGKGSAGDILEKLGFIKESFAKPVKDAIAPIFGWERSLLEGDTEESRKFREQPDQFWSVIMGKDFTPRQALQLMGTEAGRNVFHKDLWTNSLIKRMDLTKNYVITDVRFPNELKMIRDIGGKIIHIQRGPVPEWWNAALNVNMNTEFSGEVQKLSYGIHYSEWAWIGSEYINGRIDNNGTLEDLEKKILDFIQ